MIANNIIPIIFLLIIVYGMFKGRKVYEWFLEGAKEGLMVCVKIFPALLAMMIAIRIFKDANLLNYLNNLLEPIVSLIGLPKDIVPLVLIKPLSGSGALGVYTELINTLGPDTREGLISSVIMGGTETIFYTMSVYFMTAKVTKTRYTLPGALLATLAGLAASVVLGTMVI